MLRSLNDFVLMLESAAHSTLKLPLDYTWTSPLTESPFRSVCVGPFSSPNNCEYGGLAF